MAEDITTLWDRLSLTEEESKDVVVKEGDIHATLERGRFCLIGKIITEKRVNRDAFKGTMLKIWKVDTTVNIVDVGFNLFLFEFANETDLQKVCDGQPWSFDQCLLCIKYFDGLTSPSAMPFTHTYLWIQLHNLPFGCMNAEIGVQLGSSVGKVIHVEADEMGICWGRYLRVLLELDFTMPLIRGKMINVYGKRSFIQFKYERMPRFCFYCGLLLHGTNGCSQKPYVGSERDVSNLQYGSWMRASITGPYLGLSKFVSAIPMDCFLLLKEGR
ncbi:hypothetical protein F2P56_034307 [Juglans regia]|uniref:DUF4283 domain-containing protein n=2 Tax=Juglans regia TaxID=51240 RepID=A0A833WVX0_JUGRE|nr:uncharacterized protein LOC108992727 [Juglans regia]KAF5445241.1 hypothetical protein F2P56_034307 [Juglans regia]